MQGFAGYLLAPGFTINIRPGCDAYQSSAVLLAGIAAFPAPRGRKLVGAALGTTVLLGLNVLRLALILVTGLRRKELFDTMHLEVMPAVLLFAALALWLGWMLWVRSAKAPGPES